MFCGRHLAKTVVFTQFSACCKNDFFHAKSPKNTVNYSVLAFDTQWKTSENNQNCPNWSSLKKRGGRQLIFGALPSQAPASPSQTGPNQNLPPPHTPQISFASLIPILGTDLRLDFVYIYIYTYPDRFGTVWLVDFNCSPNNPYKASSSATCAILSTGLH